MRETQKIAAPKNAEEARALLRSLAEEVRMFGLGKQAEILLACADALEPPKLEGLLAGLDAPRAWPTMETVRWIAEHLQSGILLVRELSDDAEITGSLEILERARAWLRALEQDSG